MLDVSLFRNPRFTAASASVAISFFALCGFIFLVTQHFQFLKRYGPLSTGLRLLPVACAVATSSILGARLAVRVGTKLVAAAGLFLMTPSTYGSRSRRRGPATPRSPRRWWCSERAWV
jgi:hypothetical protein